MAVFTPVPDALQLPAAPLLAAVQQAARGRGVRPTALLGNTGYHAYVRARQRGTVTLPQAEGLCDLLGCHPYELYGAAYQRLALSSIPGPLEPEAAVTAWHQASCARAGCGQPIDPGDLVGLVRDVGPCCAACCGLDRPPARGAETPPAATTTTTTTSPPPQEDQAA